MNKRLLNPRGTTTETWQIKAAPGGTGWDEELLHSSHGWEVCNSQRDGQEAQGPTTGANIV